MTPFATALKTEVTRLARKELRQATAGLQTASAQYRKEIATLKRRVAELDRQLRALSRMAPAKAPTPEPPQARPRITPKGMRALRTRLKLTRTEMGQLMAVSEQTISNWETDTAPRPQHFPRILAARSLTARAARQILQGASGATA